MKTPCDRYSMRGCFGQLYVAIWAQDFFPYGLTVMAQLYYSQYQLRLEERLRNKLERPYEDRIHVYCQRCVDHNPFYFHCWHCCKRCQLGLRKKLWRGARRTCGNLQANRQKRLDYLMKHLWMGPHSRSNHMIYRWDKREPFNQLSVRPPAWVDGHFRVMVPRKEYIRRSMLAIYQAMWEFQDREKWHLFG